MDQKKKLYIYDRKEIIILSLLGVMVSLFSFTMGVHMGKGLSPAVVVRSGPAQAVDTEDDTVPNRQELQEEGQRLEAKMDETLNRTLHDEVARTGIKLDVQRQLELPKKTKSKNAGATTAAAHPSGIELKKDQKSDDLVFPGKKAAPEQMKERFSLRVGSYNLLADAEKKVSDLSAKGLTPTLREAMIEGHRWYQVYLGSYVDSKAAGMAGQKYRESGVIEDFTIAEVESADMGQSDIQFAGSTKAEMGEKVVIQKPKLSAGRFSLQIGSFPSRDEAKARVKALSEKGLEPFYKEAKVKGKRWFRVYTGRYPTRKSASAAGKEYKKDGMIGQYIVANPGS